MSISLEFFSRPLNSSQQLKLYLEYTYEASAQYDNPPAHYMSDICNAIDGAPEGTSILGRVAEGVNASAGPPCHRIYDFQPSNMSGWLWQVFLLLASIELIPSPPTSTATVFFLLSNH